MGWIMVVNTAAPCLHRSNYKTKFWMFAWLGLYSLLSPAALFSSGKKRLVARLWHCLLSCHCEFSRNCRPLAQNGRQCTHVETAHQVLIIFLICFLCLPSLIYLLSYICENRYFLKKLPILPWLHEQTQYVSIYRAVSFLVVLLCSQFHDNTLELAEISQRSCTSTSQVIQHYHTKWTTDIQRFYLAAVTPVKNSS